MAFSLHDLKLALGTSLVSRGPSFEVVLSAGGPGEEPLFEHASGDLIARIEVRTFDDEGEGGARKLRDIKCQEVCVVPAARRRDGARATAFVRAWARGLPSIAAAFRWGVEMTMPYDLIYPEALDDDTLQTESDFAAAMADGARVLGWYEARYQAEMREELAFFGLDNKVDEFLALRRPSIRFGEHEAVDEDEDESAGSAGSADSANDGPVDVGRTRFGGEPDLPPSFEWPTHEGRSMVFAAQLNLDELAALPAANELPQEGLLSFFYDPAGDFSKGIEYAARVLHFASRAGLARRPTPPDGDRRPAFLSEPASIDDTMPPLESPFYEAMLPDERALTFRRSLAAAAKGASSVADPLEGLGKVLNMFNDGVYPSDDEHRLLGYARPHQGDPYLEAEIYATGRDWKAWEEGSPGALRTLRVARRWRLLLQICAQIDGTLLLNQDCGALFFFLPEDALAAHDWGRVWCVLQCS